MSGCHCQDVQAPQAHAHAHPRNARADEVRGTHRVRERQREKRRERESERARETETDRESETDRQTEGQRQTDTHTHTQTEKARGRQTHAHTHAHIHLKLTRSACLLDGCRRAGFGSLQVLHLFANKKKEFTVIARKLSAAEQQLQDQRHLEYLAKQQQKQ